MNHAVLFGLGTMLAWGFWIIFGDIASSSMDPETAAFLSYLVATLVTGTYVLVSDASVAVTNEGLVYVGLAGVAAAIGVVSTFVGTTVGSTAIVSTIGGMYFVTAALLSVVAFGEALSLNKVVAIGFALLAIVTVNA